MKNISCTHFSKNKNYGVLKGRSPVEQCKNQGAGKGGLEREQELIVVKAHNTHSWKCLSHYLLQPIRVQK